MVDVYDGINHINFCILRSYTEECGNNYFSVLLISDQTHAVQPSPETLDCIIKNGITTAKKADAYFRGSSGQAVLSIGRKGYVQGAPAHPIKPVFPVEQSPDETWSAFSLFWLPFAVPTPSKWFVRIREEFHREIIANA